MSCLLQLCFLLCGATTFAKGDIQANFTSDLGRGNFPYDYEHRRNTQYEEGVPQWDLLPGELDFKAFDEIRFDRYLTSDTNPAFKRRIPWLYPHDGCSMRAQLLMERITYYLRNKYPSMKWDEPHKHFVFGDLTVNITENYKVQWWYHTALIIRLRDEKLYILDPALSANPIEKDSWYKLMTAYPISTITGYVTCESLTYTPFDDCFNPDRIDGNILERDIETYLNAEWKWQESIGRDPADVLGANRKYYLQG